MQTLFSAERLADPDIAEANAILRKCVHCGLCTATCPTYLTLGDELDSPRGRIYLIKDALENDRAPDARFVRHIDRCLSCLSCATTCPSGVDYAHLIDQARVRIESQWKRPWTERAIRSLLALILPFPRRMRAALLAARFARPLAKPMEKIEALKPLAAMLRLAPRTSPPKPLVRARPAASEARQSSRGRIAILSGCAQQALDPLINESAANLFRRLGVEIASPAGEECCGALVHHMGLEEQAKRSARRNIDAWLPADAHADGSGAALDAIVIAASGCGTAVKDYVHLLRRDPLYAERAEKVSSMAKDFSEYLDELSPPPSEAGKGIRIAYHSACSLRHGQGIDEAPKRLLRNAGFEAVEPFESHICCGSAGVYNILQPEIASRLRERKCANIERLEPDIIATGNIGCIAQIGSGTKIPILHVARLLDWAHGGEPHGVEECLLRARRERQERSSTR